MSVEFSFHRIIYKRTYKVSMTSPLERAQANIFVNFNKKALLSGPEKPGVYFRYVDNTMRWKLIYTSFPAIIFISALKFTLWKESNFSFSF